MKSLIFSILVYMTAISIFSQNNESFMDSGNSRLNCPNNLSNYQLKDNVCPWTVIPLSDSHHGEVLNDFKYFIPPYLINDQAHFAGNYLASPGDWIGLFFKDTCIAAHEIKNNGAIYTMSVPEGFNPDADLKIKWLFSESNYQTGGDYVYTFANHDMYEVGSLPYPIYGYVPDSFPPIVLSNPSIVYKHVFYYNYIGEFPIDSVAVYVDHDMVVSDSCVFGTVNMNTFVYNPDSFTCNVSTKQIFRKVKVMNPVVENENVTVKLSPNPTQGQIELYGIQNIEYEIFSITGKKIIAGNLQKIDISNFPNGTYFIYFKNCKKMQKIIKI